MSRKKKVKLALVKPVITGYVQKRIVEAMSDKELYNAPSLRKKLVEEDIHEGEMETSRQSIHYALKALLERGVIKRHLKTNYYSLCVAENG